MLRATLYGGSGLFFAVFLWVTIARLNYPFELEAYEGWILDGVRRLLQGRNIYVAPSLEYSSNIYPPLYYCLGAAFARVLGLGFPALRLASLLCALTTLGILFAWVRAETRRMAPAWLAGTFFAATYAHTGAWLDLARPDSLCIVLFTGAAALVRLRPTVRGGLAAGVLMALGLFAKQTSLPIMLALVLCMFLANRRAGIVMALTGLLLYGPAFLLIDRASGGWFYCYTVEVVRGHPLRRPMLWHFWTSDILRVFWVSLIPGIGFFVRLLRGRDGSALRFYGLFGASAFLASWPARASAGGHVNAILPACIFICLLFALGMHALSENGARLRPRREGLLHLAAIFQFGLLIYHPADLIPTQADRAAGENLLRQIAAFPGDVWVTQHPYLGWMAGKSAHSIDYNDRVQTARQSKSPERVAAGAAYLREREHAVRAKRFDAIIYDGHELPERWRPYYKKRGASFEQADTFYPVSGYQTRPRTIFVPTSLEETGYSLSKNAGIEHDGVGQ